MNARERQKAEERARWGGLVFSEVNALIYISRYHGAHRTHKTVQKHLQMLLDGGYIVSDGNEGYVPSEIGRAIVRGIYGDVVNNVNQGG